MIDRIRGGWLVLCLLIGSVSMAVAQINFVATSDAKQIVAGQYFQLTFTLENARGQNFRAPSFLDFEVVGGPAQSTQMTIINGRSTQRLSYSYSLTSDKIGKYTIGSASIDAGGQTYKTKPITIEVLKGKKQSATSQSALSDEAIIVEAELDHNIGYVGQQLTLKYNIITTKDVRSYNFGRLPSFDGFFAQEIQGYNGATERIVRDGVQYVKRTVKCIALFPQQKGVFEFDQAVVDLGLSDGQRSSNFFFNRRLKQFRTKTNKLTVSVKDLPEDAPTSFSGAVGRFEIASSVDKRSVAMDDAVTLTLQVRGIGDGKFIEAPKQPFDESFDIYDPNLIDETVQVTGDKIKYVKTYEYLMVPKRSGRLSITPELTYYDTDSASYITVEDRTYSVNVFKSTGRELADVESQQTVLTPTYMKTNLSRKGDYFAGSPGHWALSGTFLLGALGLFIAKRRQVQIDNIDPAIKRRNKALKLAESRLSVAKDHLKNDDVQGFYIELRKGLLSYLADQINLPSSQLSKIEIADLLSKNGLTDFLPDIMDIMQKGEQAIYASITPGSESSTYDKALSMIQEIEVALIEKVTS